MLVCFLQIVNNMVFNVPVAVIASDRPYYLYRLIEQFVLKVLISSLINANLSIFNISPNKYFNVAVDNKCLTEAGKLAI